MLPPLRLTNVPVLEWVPLLSVTVTVALPELSIVPVSVAFVPDRPSVLPPLIAPVALTTISIDPMSPEVDKNDPL